MQCVTQLGNWVCPLLCACLLDLLGGFEFTVIQHLLDLVEFT